MSSILALGADIKNRICLAKDGEYFFGPDIGNLEDAGNFSRFEKEAESLRRKCGIDPDIVVSDMHPGYFSTRYAERSTLYAARLTRIQHHHAHIASVMAEHGLKGPVIGVAFDGTGYGTDGTIWGGEFLSVYPGGFERQGALKAVPMPGQDTVIREPWRMAFSYLYDALGHKIFDHDLDFLRKVSREKLDILEKMILKRVNCPLTSSAGRLFDAVSALLGLGNAVNYEAEAPIKLERLAGSAGAVKDCYDFEILDENKNPRRINTQALFLNILDDMKNNVPKEKIAIKFHNTLSNMIVSMCAIVKNSEKIDTICLGGGVFQNKILLDRTSRALEEAGFSVFVNKKTPVNDLGISIGQVYICA